MVESTGRLESRERVTMNEAEETNEALRRQSPKLHSKEGAQDREGKPGAGS